MIRTVAGRLLLSIGASAAVLTACQDSTSTTIVSLSEVQLIERQSVGLVDGDAPEVFGLIRSVRSLGDGSFLVLDLQTPGLTWFDLDGRYRGGVHQEGSGPGELLQPTVLAVLTGDSVAIVYDPPNGRFAYYGLESDGLQHVSSFPGPRSEAFCSVGDRLFNHRHEDGALFHEVSRDGVVLRSFGQAVPAEEEEFGPVAAVITAQRNAGMLRCLETQGTLISVGINLPSIQAYSFEGELRWEVEPTGFRPWEWIPIPQGGVRYEAHPEGSHTGISVVPWTAASVLVQYAVSWPDSIPFEERDRDFFLIESREVALDTGIELGRSTSMPFIADVRGAYVYSFENLPWPRVRVLERVN